LLNNIFFDKTKIGAKERDVLISTWKQVGIRLEISWK